MSTTVAASDLTDAELTALRGAGAWYAKYHAERVAELAEDPSAYAEYRRDSFLELVGALRKLGVPMALPEPLRRCVSGQQGTPHVVADRPD